MTEGIYVNQCMNVSSLPIRDHYRSFGGLPFTNVISGSLLVAIAGGQQGQPNGGSTTPE